MTNKYEDLAVIFKALSDPTRLKIIEMISEKEMCACEILEEVNIKQSTLSYHMKILSDNNLVESTPKGSWVWYQVNNQHNILLKEYLEIIFKQNDKSIHIFSKIGECGINE